MSLAALALAQALVSLTPTMENTRLLRELVPEAPPAVELTGALYNKECGCGVRRCQPVGILRGKSNRRGEYAIDYFASPDSVCGHAFCKTNALQYVCEKFNVQFRNCIAVGDSVDDLCMIGHAGMGVAFCAKEKLLEKVAAKVIREKSFRSLFEFVK